MVRPKLPITRDEQLNIGLTRPEYESVLQRSRAAGMRPVDYGRWRLLSGKAVATAAAAFGGQLDPLLLSHLSRIGSNLNQIARQLNALRLPLPNNLEPLLAELREMLGKVRS